MRMKAHSIVVEHATQMGPGLCLTSLRWKKARWVIMYATVTKIEKDRYFGGASIKTSLIGMQSIQIILWK